MPVDARAGVQHAGLVDPRAKTIEGYRLDADAWARLATFSGDKPNRAASFQAVDIPPPWSGT